MLIVDLIFDDMVNGSYVSLSIRVQHPQIKWRCLHCERKNHPKKTISILPNKKMTMTMTMTMTMKSLSLQVNEDHPVVIDPCLDSVFVAVVDDVVDIAASPFVVDNVVAVVLLLLLLLLLVIITTMVIQ